MKMGWNVLQEGGKMRREGLDAFLPFLRTLNGWEKLGKRSEHRILLIW